MTDPAPPGGIPDAAGAAAPMPAAPMPAAPLPAAGPATTITRAPDSGPAVPVVTVVVAVDLEAGQVTVTTQPSAAPAPPTHDDTVAMSRPGGEPAPADLTRAPAPAPTPPTSEATSGQSGTMSAPEGPEEPKGPVDPMVALFPAGRIPVARFPVRAPGSLPAGLRSTFAPGSVLVRWVATAAPGALPGGPRWSYAPASIPVRRLPVPTPATIPAGRWHRFSAGSLAAQVLAPVPAPQSIAVPRARGGWAIGTIPTPTVATGALGSISLPRRPAAPRPAVVPRVAVGAPASIATRRVTVARGAGTIGVPRVSASYGRARIMVRSVPTRASGSIRVDRVPLTQGLGPITVQRVPYGTPGGTSVTRVRTGLPTPGSLTAPPTGARTGPSERGTITLADGVVETIASRAAIEVDDAGGVAATVLGRDLTAGGHGRRTALDSPPRVKAHVDGTEVYLGVRLSVRYPAPVPRVADAVRTVIGQRVAQMAGLHVAETTITVQALITQAPSRPRVR